MSVFLTRGFWADTAERAARTCAQVALACLTLDTLFDARTWQTIGLATLFSLLTSIAGRASGSPSNASLLPLPPVARRPAPVPQKAAADLARTAQALDQPTPDAVRRYQAERWGAK